MEGLKELGSGLAVRPRHENITLAPDRLDVAWGGQIGFDQLAQPRDLHIHAAVVGLEFPTARELGLSNEDAIKLLLGEKEPSMQFTTPEELGELAVFFCSAAANNVRGVAWNMDGGWAAQ